jgi:adenylate cyclase
MRRPRLRGLLLAATALAAFAVALAAYATDALDRAELGTVDLRFTIHGTQPAPQDVVFVKFDDVTFDELAERWPFRRSLHARAIERIHGDGAAVIGYDVQFSEPSGPTEQDAEEDNALIEAVRASGNIVLATTEVAPGGETRVFGGGEGLRHSRGIPAYSGFPNDPGRVVRRMATSVRGLDSFPVALAERWTGRAVEDESGDAHHWIDYAGPPGTVPSIPFSRVLAGRFEPGTFRGKVVLVGASAPSLQDLHPTSTTGETPMPGPEIHANAVLTAARGFPLRDAPGALNVAIIALLAVAAPLASARLGRWAALAVALGAAAAAAVGAQLAFEEGRVVSVVYPAVAWGLASVGAVGVHAITAAFERERTRDLFARFVPESVVDEALAQSDGLRLGGVRREGTVMFSDLRGFTSFAETLAPDEVIAILNRYLTEMSDAILDEGGTLVAYMGDGIMAVFGAPLEQGDHADRALRAAEQMLARMEAFNDWLREQGVGGGFKMGIGLNSGPVMSGHVGSERRLEYTAIGDTTNTAARLEGMTKGTPHQLFVAESTHALLEQGGDRLEFAGEFEVRGRQAKIRLWAPQEQPAPSDEPHAAAPGDRAGATT